MHPQRQLQLQVLSWLNWTLTLVEYWLWPFGWAHCAIYIVLRDASTRSYWPWHSGFNFLEVWQRWMLFGFFVIQDAVLGSLPLQFFVIQDAILGSLPLQCLQWFQNNGLLLSGIFAWLVLQNCVWTVDHCLCKLFNRVQKSPTHILFQCCFSRRIWTSLKSWFKLIYIQPQEWTMIYSAKYWWREVIQKRG
jgi:hypothetical protein